MRKTWCIVCAMVILSCTKEVTDGPAPQSLPLLKRTVQTDTSGAVMRVTHYNEFELVTFDTAYDSKTHNVGLYYINEYNAKGKRIKQQYFLPILYTGGSYWEWHYHYQNDTLPDYTYRYFRGNQVAHNTYFYNAARQLVMDSTYHTPNYGTYTYLSKFTYDAAGRIASSLNLNEVRDTTAYITYQYTPNKVEKTTMNIMYTPQPYITNGITTTEYTSNGKILLEKGINPDLPQHFTQTAYTYDGSGNLLKKITTSSGAAPAEERYFNNSTTGKPEKMEYYLDNRLIYVVTYFYE